MNDIRDIVAALRVSYVEWTHLPEDEREQQYQSFIDSTTSYHVKALLKHMVKMGPCSMSYHAGVIQPLIEGARPWMQRMQLDNPIIGGFGPRFRQEQYGDEEDREVKVPALSPDEFVAQFTETVIDGVVDRLEGAGACTPYAHGDALFVEWFFWNRWGIAFDMHGPLEYGVTLPACEVLRLDPSYEWIDVLVYPSQIDGRLEDATSTVRGLRDNPGEQMMQLVRNAGGGKMRIKTVQEPWMACVVKALATYFSYGIFNVQEIDLMRKCLALELEDLDHPAAARPVVHDPNYI